jgi:hypothetical protein
MTTSTSLASNAGLIKTARQIVPIRAACPDDFSDTCALLTTAEGGVTTSVQDNPEAIVPYSDAGTNVNQLTSQHPTHLGRGPVFYHCLAEVCVASPTP